ncbi:MAG: DUF4347 domain-containing protein [Chlorobium phaeovibrioides]|nr:DUF4347 domain-containing protein [Chlorobium phaeovibrioides]
MNKNERGAIMVGSIVFIDSSVNEKEYLLSLSPAGFLWYVLDEEIDGIEQIVGSLSGLGELDSIHIISHGSPGSITIGSTVLDSESLVQYSSGLAALGAVLRDGGDLMLYGCNVASGAAGSAFIDAFSAAIGADVAGSDDLSGGIPAGGDWELEVQSGPVTEPVLLLPATYPRILDADGSLGTEFRLNTTADAAQTAPFLAALKNGGFVAAWTSYGQDGSVNGVFARQYTALGASGREFQVNTHFPSQQQAPSVASLEGGGFVVVWNSYGQDGDGYGIYLQRYDAAGRAAGDELQVNTYTAGSQSSSGAAGLSDGGFVVVWASDGQDGDGDGIYLQRYDAGGDAVGSELQVNTHTAGAQSSPMLTGLAGGGFAVVWASDGQDGDGDGIYLQRYGVGGDAVGSELQVNTHTAGAQSTPAVASLADGGFVITWQSDGQDGSNLGVYAQRYDEYGLAANTEFLVNTKTSWSQSAPAIAAMGEGFVITWQASAQDGSDSGVYAQCYDASGVPVDSEFRVNTEVEGAQGEPTAIMLGDEGVVVAWQSNGQDGSTWGIYAQRFDAEGVPVTVVPLSYTALALNSMKTATGLDVEVWLTAGIQVDVIDLEFSYRTEGAAYTGHSIPLEDWELIATESLPGVITFAGYAADFELLGGDADILLGTFSFTFTGDEPDFAFSLSDYSILANSALIPAEINLGILSALHAPVLAIPIPDQNVDEDALYQYALETSVFTDLDATAGDVLIYSAALDDGSNLPSWLQFDAISGVLSGTPLNSDVGSINLKVSVTDQGGLSKSDVFSLLISNVNDAPVVATPIADASVDENNLYTFTLSSTSFIDPDAGDVLAYRAALGDGSALPAWLDFDVSTLTFSGTPQGGDVGALTIILEASDLSGATVADTFVLMVNLVNASPTGGVSIDGTPAEYSVLTADTQGLADADGLGTLSYQWYADGVAIVDADAEQYILTNSDIGTSLRVDVSYVDLRGTEELIQSGATDTVANVNDIPGGRPVITGIARDEETLSVDIAGISDADGLGEGYAYQWYLDGAAIVGATSESYLVSEGDVCSAITVTLSYTDAQGTAEVVESAATAPVKWAVSDLSGEVRFWKTGEVIGGVALAVTSASFGGENETAVFIEDIEQMDDGSKSMDIWAKSTDSYERLQLSFTLQEGSSAGWEDAASIPPGWSTLSVSDAGTVFNVSGMGIDAIANGSFKLGTLTLSAPDDPDRFEVSLVSGELGSAGVSALNILSEAGEADAGGLFLFEEMTRANYTVSAGKDADETLSEAVRAADALAALKMAVGLNPNADGSDVSSSSFLAADVNHDGQVRATDALAILKMAVGLESAPDPEWLFVNSDIDNVVMSRKDVDWEGAAVDAAIAGDMQVDIVGIVKGDVNGSWVGPVPSAAG